MQKSKTERNYIEVLKESLVKKKEILEEILTLNDKQREIIEEENLDPDEFDKVVDRKTTLIKKIEELDEGFTAVYNRIKILLSEHKDEYSEDIRNMQEYIKIITDLAVKVEISEKRNKDIFDKKSYGLHAGIKASRTTNKVAAGYYQNMSKTNVIEPQFLDKKN